MRMPLRTLLLAACLLAPVAASTVELAGRRIPTSVVRGSEYVGLPDVLRALNGRCWRVGERFVVLLPGDSAGPRTELVFRPESTVAILGDRRVNMVLPAVLADSELALPAVALADLFPGSKSRWMRSVEAEMSGDTFVLRMNIDAGDSLVCHGETRSSLEYRLALAVRIDSAAVEQLKLLPVTGAGMLRSVTVDRGASTALHFAFGQSAFVRLSTRCDGAELRIWPRPARRVSRIVLDAGHGGKDPGAVGRGGTHEKRIVLDITRRLQKKLQAQGFEVILTRDTDDYVSLAERSKCGNSRKADLFVSIHANAAVNRASCGFETYFLSDAKTDWERAVAARENASFEEHNGKPTGGSTDDVGLILADLAQNEFLWESSDLAAKIQEATVPHARIMDRGVRQANFYVLRNCFMPSVLVECGFISNRSEEKLLQNPKHRERLAEGISRGIVTYARQYGQKSNGQGKPESRMAEQTPKPEAKDQKPTAKSQGPKPKAKTK